MKKVILFATQGGFAPPKVAQSEQSLDCYIIQFNIRLKQQATAERHLTSLTAIKARTEILSPLSLSLFPLLFLLIQIFLLKAGCAFGWREHSTKKTQQEGKEGKAHTKREQRQ
jgi:hypothetical protein